MKTQMKTTSAVAVLAAMMVGFAPALTAADQAASPSNRNNQNAASGSSSSMSSSSSANRQQQQSGVRAASGQHAGYSARDIIGQDVKSKTGEDLGEVKDLVINSSQGKLVYAIITSGGVLGVGETLRAVPFKALQKPGAATTSPTTTSVATMGDDNALTLDLDKAKWDTAPTIRDNDIEQLWNEVRGREVYSFYALDWNEDMKASGNNQNQTASNNQQQGQGQLMRVSKLIGKDLTNAGQEVGEIEDVIINFQNRRASVLIDADDDFVGTDQEYIINFNRLTVAANNENVFNTTLTREDFSRATPAQTDWWIVTTGQPYVWTGYIYTAGSGYSADANANASAMASTRNNNNNNAQASTSASSNRNANANASGSDRASVSAVRDAIQNDPALSSAAKQVTIREQNRTLVISGTVPSEDMKERIADKVEEAARGWNVDNKLTVRAAAE